MTEKEQKTHRKKAAFGRKAMSSLLAAAMVVSSGAVSFLGSSTVARAADPVVLSPNTSVNGKNYVFSSDYGTRVHYGASSENEAFDKSHAFIQNGAMLERIPDVEGEKAGKVKWRATFNKDMLENYGMDGYDLDGAGAHTSNPYFSVILSKGIKFASDRALITAYWKNENNQIIGKSASEVSLVHSTVPEGEDGQLKSLVHPEDSAQKLGSLFYYEEKNNVVNDMNNEMPIYDSVYTSLAAYLRQSNQVELDPSNEGGNPRSGGYSWTKKLGDFSKLPTKQFADEYAGWSTHKTVSDKAGRVLNLKYMTPGTSDPARRKNAMVTIDFETEVDPDYTEQDPTTKNNFVMASYKSLDDNSTFMRGDFVNIDPIDTSAPVKEEWKLKVDEKATAPAKVIPSHKLVINTNGAGTYLDDVKITKAETELTKDYIIKSPVAVPDTDKTVDPVYVRVADSDGVTIPYHTTTPSLSEPDIGTYGGYDFKVKQTEAYNYDNRQSHWDVEWIKRDDHGTNFDKENITKIKIINPPAKTEYKTGDNLDLTGMMVELTDKDGNKLLLTPDEFEAYKLKVDPADKSQLKTPGENIPVTVSSVADPNVKDSTPIKVTGDAITDDPVIVVEDPATPVPEGYVRLTFDAKEGSFGKDASGKPVTKKYLDVKKDLTGKELKDSKKLPADPTADKKTFKAWDPALPGDADKITETKTYGATYTDNTPAKPAAPVVDTPKSGDTVVKVAPPADADTIEVTLPGGKKVVVTKDPASGKWTTGDGAEVPIVNGKLEIPTGDAPLKANDTITVVNKNNGTPSDPTAVTVPPSDADKYTPNVKTIDVKKGSTPNPADQITNKHGDPAVEGKPNLPEGTKFEYVETPDTSTSGDKPVKIKVTYPDGSTEVVDGTIHVNTDAEQWKKDNTDEDGNFTGKGSATVEEGGVVDPNKVTVNPSLPDGAKVTSVGEVDTTTPTEADSPRKTTGTVTFADGSTITDLPVEVTVTPKDAKPTDAQTYEPQVKKITVDKGTTPNPADQITNKHGDPAVEGKPNLPEGTKFEYVETPDTSTPGDKPVKIKVTYPDGSTETVDGTIHVNSDAEKYRKDNTDENGNFTGKGSTTVEQGGTVDPSKVTVTPALPTGASVTEVGTVDTTTPTEADSPRKTTGTVTFADGSTITDLPVEVTVTAKPDEKPTKPVVDPIKAGDNKVKVGEPLIGDTVVVTLPDGSEVVVKKDPTTGKWTTGDGAEVPVVNGKLEIPVDPTKTTEGGEVTVVTKKGDSVSEPTKTTIGKPEKPEKPVVDPIKPGDNKVTVGVPLIGDKIEITLPDGTKVTVDKDPNTGKWMTGTGEEVPEKNGKLEIPVDPTKTTEGGEVTVVVSNGGVRSDATVVKIAKDKKGAAVVTKKPASSGNSKSNVPKTGVPGIDPSIFGMLSASAAGIFMTLKKRKKD